MPKMARTFRHTPTFSATSTSRTGFLRATGRHLALSVLRASRHTIGIDVEPIGTLPRRKLVSWRTEYAGRGFLGNG